MPTFLLLFWKQIGIALLVIGIIIAGKFWINSIEDAAYDKGVLAENTRYAKIIADEELRNRNQEQKLRDVVAQYEKRIKTNTAERTNAEATHLQSLNTILSNNSVYKECKVDTSVLNELNAIRKLGPQK
jgi:hypothetical protein